MFGLTVVIQENLRHHSYEIRAWKRSLETVQQGGKTAAKLTRY